MPERIKPALLPAMTGLRAYAALWVVWFHFQEFIRLQGMPFDLGALAARGYLGVDIFFVLSGFILAYVYDDALKGGAVSYRRYLWLRFIRIYPVHLVTFLALLAYVGLRYAVGIDVTEPERFNFFNAFLNLSLLHSFGFDTRLSWNVPSWSISAEFFAYAVIFPLCARLWHSKSWAQVFIMAAAGWLWVYHLGMSVKGNLSLSHDYGFIRIIPEFAAGYLLYQYARKQQLQAPLGAVCGYLALGGFALLILLPARFEWAVLPLILLLLYGLIQPRHGLEIVFANKAAQYLGTISYSLYMTHFILVIPISAAFKLGLVEQPTRLISVAALFICYLVASLVVAALCYHTVEEPLRRRLQRVQL